MTRRSLAVALVAAALAVSACTSEAAVTSTQPSISPTSVPAGSTSAPTTFPAEPAPSGIGDRLYPALGNGGYDVERYAFTVGLEDGGVEASATIDMALTEDLSSLNLDLAGLEVVSVLVDGEPADFAQEGRELVVVVGGEAGTSIEVTVDYGGVPSAVPAAAVPFAPGWQDGNGVSYLFSQPDGAQSLFPVNDHPLDRADVELTITVPDGLEVISGGELVAEATVGGETSVTWSMDDIAPYLIPLGIGDFELVSDREVDGVRYDVWASSALSELPQLDVFDAQPDIVAFFEERFGRYPFDRAGALVVDDELAAALETQTIPTYTRVSVGWGEVVVAHELAHQWFGDWIALAQWDDIWLNEGFATFAHWLWIEERQGSDAYDREIVDAYETFSGARFAAGGADPADAVERAIDAFPPPDHPRASDLFNPSVYERAGLTLVAMRDRVGDEAMFEFTRTYAQRLGGGTTSTQQFLDVVDEVLGSDVAALAERWIGDPLPPAMPERGLSPLEP